MKIACIGTGFVGVVTACIFAKLGHQVVGIDIDASKVESLGKGKVPFFEPGLEELLVETQKSGKLTFTTSYQDGVTDAGIVMLMVGTPSKEDGSADLQYLFASATSLAPYLQEGAIVVVKSTVPPGTNEKVKEIIHKISPIKFELASVPEFLKEGTAVEDTLHPDRVIIGAENKEVIAKLKSLHQPLTNNFVIMKAESAQMAKYAANVYLATRITFANQIADLCEKNGADIQEVIKGIGADQRIGSHYWYPGMGYGGSCFPKDVKEIAAYAKSVGEAESIFITLNELNEKRIPRLMASYDKLVGGFSGKKVAVLGLSFKPNTNDTRVAPALSVIPYLTAHQATVVTCDPIVVSDTKDPYQAATGAHVLILLVEWDEYKSLDLSRLSSIMATPKYFLDTRNQYDPQYVAKTGIIYKGIGR